MDSKHTLTIDSPCLVFGGPYGNLHATKALLTEARRLRVPAERIICTGDLVAYCADPAATIDLIRSSGMHVVMGNCDEQLAIEGADCGCGFPSGSACERLSSAWFAYADSQIGADIRRWLRLLPRRIDLIVGGARLAVIHGGVEQINRYVFASTAAALKQRELDVAGADGVITGHSGLPFTQCVGDRLWHNAGAIGLPANDGTPRVWYSLLTPGPEGLRIEHRPLSYDTAAACAAMRLADLPDEYAETLATGLWPSCDVLPYREIRERGVALEAGSFLWALPKPKESLARKRTRAIVEQVWPPADRGSKQRRLDPRKFQDPLTTAAGEPRARVAMTRLETLWINTGSLCNIACRNCYIESSPRNDRLSYITLSEVRLYLDEIERERLGTREIGLTGGEPFMNPEILDIIEECLQRGFRVLVLTNAMRPMQRHKLRLLNINRHYGRDLTVRVSLDHYTPERHEEERGPGTFAPTRNGLLWLAQNGFAVAVAGRTMWGEDLAAERAGFQRLFDEHAIPLEAGDPRQLVLFPEMDQSADVPEITEACWGILGKSPQSVMCATSRMVVKRKGADHPVVLPCTLIPYDTAFEMGRTLADASRLVPLNHPHCARFCVLGGGSCSAHPASSDASRARGELAKLDDLVAVAT